MAKWLSENPAKLIRKQKSKGKITVDFNIDFRLWDDEKQFDITEKIIQHKNKITPFMNKTLTGVTKQTYLDGLKVSDNGIFAAFK